MESERSDNRLEHFLKNYCNSCVTSCTRPFLGGGVEVEMTKHGKGLGRY